MNQEPCQCIYCGSNDVAEYVDHDILEHANQVFVCHSCQFMFTDLERRFEKDYKPKYKNAGAASERDEEATINYVHNLLSNDINVAKCLPWNTALEHLSNHDEAIKHPLEYMVYRDICQIGSACAQNHILKECENYDPIADSIVLLNVLNNNLQHLDYFLPKNDEDKRFIILQRLYNAMLLFADAPIKKAPLKGEEAKEFVKQNMEKRITAIIALTDHLVGLQDTADGVDYLKMAKEILKKCLDTYETNYFSYTVTKNAEARHRDRYRDRELFTTEDISPLKTYIVSKENFDNIIERLRTINGGLSQMDPNYKPEWFETALSVAIVVVLALVGYAAYHFRGESIQRLLISSSDALTFIVPLVLIAVMAYFSIRKKRAANDTKTATSYNKRRESDKSQELNQQLYNDK